MRAILPTVAVLFSFVPSAAAAAEVDLPENARQVLAQNGWHVLVRSEIVPGTERFRAPSYHHTYYAAELGADKGRVVFDEPRAHDRSFRPMRIAPDGTVSAAVIGAEADNFLVLAPGDAAGRRGDGVAVLLPGPQPDAAAMILHATAGGLVAYPRPRNPTGKVVPIYFLPLDGGKIRPEKAVELSRRGASSLMPSRTGFVVSDRWVVWADGSYEVATGQTRKRMADKGNATLIGIDGDLVVTHVVSNADNRTVHELVAADLKTGTPVGRRGVTSDVRVAALHDGVAYTLTRGTTKPGERGPRLELVAFELARPAAVLLNRIVIEGAKPTAPIVFTATGFAVPGVDGGDVEWVTRKK